MVVGTSPLCVVSPLSRVKTLAHSVADRQSKLLSLIVEDRCSVSQFTEPVRSLSFSLHSSNLVVLG